MITAHDAYRYITSQNVAYAVSGGASALSTVFAAQTRWIRVVAVGVVDTTNNGCRIVVGDNNPTAINTSSLLPLNWESIIKVSPGQKIAVLGNSAAIGNLNVTELSD